MLLRFLIVCWFGLGVARAASAPFDVIVRGGRVVDGQGNPARFLDVAVRGGRIVEMGRISGSAGIEIDARGLTVAPGFIDIHTHAEEICELPLAENFLRMGVTTLVLGNCGSSVVDVAEFFHQVETNRVAVNVGTLIGHGTIRASAMGGSFMRPPTAPELAQMKLATEKAMNGGALGISTGLIYLPGTFARTEELVELASVVARWGGIYVSHMRDEGTEIFSALDEVFRIASEARVAAHVSHIKLSGQNMWGRADEVLGAIEKARLAGLDITQDQYLYTASSTGISQLIPGQAREGGAAKFLERIQDPARKREIVEEMKSRLKRRDQADFSYAVIASYAQDRELNGKTIPEAARLKRGSDTLDEQIELILEIQKEGGASGVFHGMSEDDLRAFLRHPNTMIASDSGMRRFGEGVPHPRGYGNCARLLAKYVRDEKVLRLEEAVRRVTSLPATTFRIKDRGVLRVGAWADLIVFDPETVQDRATFAQPHQYATGIEHALVNGVPVLRNGQSTGDRPGRVVRGNDEGPATR
jgi:N-acyl-D-amino-acid deacylase